MSDEEAYQLNWEITEAMKRFGGSFVKVLGDLWRHGDRSNRRLLETAFSEYWGEYRSIVEQQRLTQKEGHKRWYE